MLSTSKIACFSGFSEINSSFFMLVNFSRTAAIDALSAAHSSASEEAGVLVSPTGDTVLSAATIVETTQISPLRRILTDPFESFITTDEMSFSVIPGKNNVDLLEGELFVNFSLKIITRTATTRIPVITKSFFPFIISSPLLFPETQR